ncbi:hypothetical protein ACFWX5_27095 [[Kitasatospora] papulosa]|uniref:hypothetical protein n=1 Tax=Streptomyces TaxID=1883 RepID=UPI0033330A3B
MTQALENGIRTLDTNTIKELARIICGDDNLYYRGTRDLTRFFENAGWLNVLDFDGESRNEWTLDRLTERRTDGAAVEQVLLRLADAREYYEEPHQLTKVLQAVNAFLVHEGLRLENPGGRPRLVTCDPSLGHPGEQAPAELQATMAGIIADERMAQLLQHRLDEARTCFANGAHIAAVIMLGSLLEGVLLTVIQERDPSLLRGRDLKRVGLGELIDICSRARWIDADATSYSHTLRDYRNFVHPHREFREEHKPDRDTLNVSWWVVNGALNDLAASHPH